MTAPEAAGTARPDMVGKALRLLELLGEHPGGLTAAEATRICGYPFSTTYRLLNALVRDGFAELQEDRRYVLGLKIFRAAHGVAQRLGITGTVVPVLRRMVERTGESCLFAVLDGDRFHTLAKEDGPDFRVTSDPGYRGALHSSALGLCLLAFAPDDVREHLLDTVELEPRTPSTLTDRDELRRRVERIRRAGWATQDQEHDVGMVAVAVPVLRPGGGCAGSLALSAPVFRHRLEDLVDMVPALQEAAGELGARLTG
ncbi:IclR family transcriptional regulator [Kocuria sp. CPCC 205292]|uniref:IclR family transcriptional regulator n=1 Tax=Kocuria cellulosilytica TaxID=3071451 RepID=UPI0034D6A6B3